MIVLVPLLLALLRRTRGTRTDSPEARRTRVPLPVSRDHDRRLPPRSGESRRALERGPMEAGNDRRQRPSRRAGDDRRTPTTTLHTRDADWPLYLRSQVAR